MRLPYRIHNAPMQYSHRTTDTVRTQQATAHLLFSYKICDLRSFLEGVPEMISRMAPCNNGLGRAGLARPTRCKRAIAGLFIEQIMQART